MWVGGRGEEPGRRPLPEWQALLASWIAERYLELGFHRHGFSIFHSRREAPFSHRLDRRPVKTEWIVDLLPGVIGGPIRQALDLPVRIQLDADRGLHTCAIV